MTRWKSVSSVVSAPIVIPVTPFSPADLEQFRGNPFESMIKFVVDIEREVPAFGGEMHADAEALLLANGSLQEHIWGGNLHPWTVPPLIEFTSLINIRPAAGNRSMIVQIPGFQDRIASVVHQWILLQW